MWKNINGKYSEIYKKIFFEKTYNKIIMSTQNNLIIIIGSAKQCETQINS
jgi:hypothetical protein